MEVPLPLINAAAPDTAELPVKLEVIISIFLASTAIPAPLLAILSSKLQVSTVKLSPVAYIPAPLPLLEVTVFFVKLVFLTVPFAPDQIIAAPSVVVNAFVKVRLLIVTLVPVILNIPDLPKASII